MPAPPLVISAQAVRDELSGCGMAFYLARLGDAAAQLAVLERAIQEAQSEYELDLDIFLTQRVIRSRPIDVTGLERGVDYDVLDDPYPWFGRDFKGGGEVRLRRRPVQSVQSFAIRYGGSAPQASYTILKFPEQWQIADERMGIVYVQPLYGAAGVVAGTLGLAMLGQGIFMRDTVPLAIAVDYTAGYLPRDFDAASDDPAEFSWDHDVRNLLQGVRYAATRNVLRSLNRAVGAGGGSIGMDGLSQSFQPNRFALEIQDYEKLSTEVKDRYRGREGPVRMIVA